jgi:hypothetical protein
MFTPCQDKYTHMSLRQAIFTIESSIEPWKNKRQLAVNSKDGRLDNFIEYGKVPIQVFCECIFFSPILCPTHDPILLPKVLMFSS